MYPSFGIEYDNIPKQVIITLIGYSNSNMSKFNELPDLALSLLESRSICDARALTKKIVEISKGFYTIELIYKLYVLTKIQDYSEDSNLSFSKPLSSTKWRELDCRIQSILQITHNQYFYNRFILEINKLLQCPLQVEELEDILNFLNFALQNQQFIFGSKVTIDIKDILSFQRKEIVLQLNKIINEVGINGSKDTNFMEFYLNVQKLSKIYYVLGFKSDIWELIYSYFKKVMQLKLSSKEKSLFITNEFQCLLIEPQFYLSKQVFRLNKRKVKIQNLLIDRLLCAIVEFKKLLLELSVKNYDFAYAYYPDELENGQLVKIHGSLDYINDIMIPEVNSLQKNIFLILKSFSEI